MSQTDPLAAARAEAAKYRQGPGADPLAEARAEAARQAQASASPGFGIRPGTGTNPSTALTKVNNTPLRPIGAAIDRTIPAIFNALDIGRRANVAMYRSPRQQQFMRATGGLLNAPLLGMNIGQTMMGRNTPEQTTASQSAILKQYHIPDNFWTQLGTSIVADPLTYAGPVAQTLHSAAEAQMLPAMVNAFEKAPPILKPFAEGMRQAHNLLSVDPGVKWALARDYAGKWVDKYAEIYQARGMIRSVRNEFVNRFGRRFLEQVHGLEPNDEGKLYDAIDKGTVGQLPADLQKRAAGIKGLTDTLHYLEGDETARAALAKQGFKLPDWAQPLTEFRPLKAATEKTYRGAYIPTRRGANAPVIGGGIINLLGEDPALLRRGLPKEAVTPEQQRKLFMGRFGAAGTNVASGTASDIIHGAFEGHTPMEVAEFFTKEFEGINPMDATKYWATKFKQLQDVQKGSLFFLPFRHMANIISLGLLKNPAAIPEALVTYARLNVKNLKPALLAKRLQDIPKTAVSSEDRFHILRDAIKAGAVPVRSAEVMGDQGSTFTQILNKLGNKIGPQEVEQAGNAVRPKVIKSVADAARWVAAAPFKAAGKWYDFVSDQLWTFDDAMKAADFRQNVRMGMSPARAALETNAGLVDYNTRSQLAEKLAYIGPFTTWRTKAPVATLRNILRNPGSFMALTRTSPGFGGGMTNQPGPRGTTSSLPAAELNQLLTKPTAYGIGTLGAPARLVGNEIFNQLDNPFDRPQVPRNPLTYGASNKEYIKSLIPGLSQYGQFHEGGLFPTTPINALISSQTGYHASTKPGLYKDTLLDRMKRQYLKTHPDATAKELNNYVRSLKFTPLRKFLNY